ncbi:MAG: thiol protease/hemagglutinin PrtT [Bacteroidales bacterium]|nr:thiol protease/hemagglutinin PrtT [Bacteroidales bacterium]
MKKSILYLLLVTLFIGDLQAKPVDVNKAKALGVKFMNVNTEIKSDQSDLVYTAYTDSGQACFYVFSVQPKGFVIVAADDRAKPILGYSTESNFIAQLPDGLKTFFDNYKAGFTQMFANNIERTEQAIADWKSLEQTGKLTVRRSVVVGPLLSSIWNQTDLYNNMAPYDPNSIYSQHCKSGCVANTMSQLMRYWEWPRSGTGSHGYDAYSYYGNYGWQEANFEEATYRFELMPDFLDFASPQAEVDATALLEYHAGVSVDMGYGPDASGAYSGDVPDALIDHFRYSPNLTYREKDWYSFEEWENFIYDNLDAGMPLYYASSGPDGGHAYVLDGYDDFYMFHLNWGWAGFDNGYYPTDGFYLTFYSFPWNHNAIFNIHPNPEYYDAPMAIENFEASTLGETNTVELTFTPVYETRGGDVVDKIDAIFIMRDGVIVDSLVDVSEPEVSFMDELEKNGTYYYTVYAVNEAGMSKVTRDTVLVGNTCDLRFELADTGDNGWDLSFIAVKDEEGKVSQRVGLWNGGSASIIVPVPSDQTATFFWTYDNTCYSHGSLAEVSYEIYDWDDNLIVSSNGYPEVGPIIDYEINCNSDNVADQKVEWSLYPNPASNSFTVEGKVKEIKVFDALGQLVHQGKDTVVDVNTWPQGMFFVRIMDESDAFSTVKFVKQ